MCRVRTENIKQIIVAGKYINDVATRLEYAGVDMSKVILRKNVDAAVAYLRFKSAADNLFAMTCFSDEGKFIREVEAEA